VIVAAPLPDHEVGRWRDAGRGGDERAVASAAPEVEEETGWRLAPLRALLRFQPMVGTVDAESKVFLARGATRTHDLPGVNKTRASTGSGWPTSPA